MGIIVINNLLYYAFNKYMSNYCFKFFEYFVYIAVAILIFVFINELLSIKTQLYNNLQLITQSQITFSLQQINVRIIKYYCGLNNKICGTILVRVASYLAGFGACMSSYASISWGK